VVSLLTDALAPTNTLLGNPAALKRVIDSGGASLLEGFKNLLADLTANRGMPAQVDTTAFQLGKNLALSPGAVVFRNDVLELIQYAPATGEVYARPQMIVPPQINKYYVFDLSPGRSIVEYLVQNGFQVFVVSWRNPTPAQSDWDMSTYVAALLESIAAVRDITGAEDVNLDGACSGAMTVAALLGHLAAKRQKLVHAATLMVAVFAANAESLLGLFATPEIIAAAKRNSRLKGVLDGQEMGRVFAWMRPNDLVWNYWVNNYLMGNPPPAFDILYWNNDATRLAAKFHGQLIDIFVDSQFQKPGVFEILGTPIDLSEVDCDKYVVAGITDHITPWKGVFSTARTFGGETDFVSRWATSATSRVPRRPGLTLSSRERGGANKHSHDQRDAGRWRCGRRAARSHLRDANELQIPPDLELYFVRNFLDIPTLDDIRDQARDPVPMAQDHLLDSVQPPCIQLLLQRWLGEQPLPDCNQGTHDVFYDQRVAAGYIALHPQPDFRPKLPIVAFISEVLDEFAHDGIPTLTIFSRCLQSLGQLPYRLIKLPSKARGEGCQPPRAVPRKYHRRIFRRCSCRGRLAYIATPR
jgi:poly(3-hydroxyalkanoate) synthetase